MMLKVAEIAAGYGRIPILSGVTFAVEQGEFVGVLGHNGMGKTTLLKALMGFLPATGGQVSLDNADVTHAPPYQRARLGFGRSPDLPGSPIRAFRAGRVRGVLEAQSPGGPRLSPWGLQNGVPEVHEAGKGEGWRCLCRMPTRYYV